MSAAEKVIDVVEDAAEIVDETLDVLEAVPAWRCGMSRKQHTAQIIALLTIGGAVGGVVAYYVFRKKLQIKYEALSAQEIKDAKEFYRGLYKKGEYETPEKVLQDRHPNEPASIEEAAEAIGKYQNGGESMAQDVSLNVFSNDSVDVDFDLDEDMQDRDEEHPYIITQEEFLQAEPGYEQQTLTYYAADDTLSDQKDEIIELPDEVVGPDTLRRFGHGSGDARTVYVRNDKLNLDFEVVRHDGKYSVDVLGDTLQHSDQNIERIHSRHGRVDE